MKTYAAITGILLLALAGCTATRQTADAYDDIYYTPGVVRSAPAQQGSYTEATVVEMPRDTERNTSGYNYQDYAQPYEDSGYNASPATGYENQQGSMPDEVQYSYDEQGNVTIINNFYGDYHDFSYTSRIRRFYRPYAHANYYGSFYTDMFWYTYDPFYSGISIYLGYGAHPFYYPGFYWTPHMSYWNFQWGWYNPIFAGGWGWRPYWARPWYGWGWGSHAYWMGYHHGFHAGMHHGYWNYYGYQYFYNSHDESNYHYGPRGSLSSTTGGNGRPADTFAQTFEARTIRNEDGTRQMIARNDARRTSPESTSAGPAGTAGLTAGQSGPASEMALPASGSRSQTEQTTDASRQQPASNRTESGQVQPNRPPAQSQPASRTAEQQTRPQQPVRTPADYQAPAREQYQRPPAERYQRPQPASRESGAERSDRPNFNPPRTYTSPSYQQPRSTEQYRPPQPASQPPAQARPAESTRPSGSTQPAGTQTRPAPQQVQPQARPQAPPARQPAQYNPPARQDRGQPTYTPPARQQPSSSPAPSRQINNRPAPQRSTPSAPPAVSSPPARSSGSSSAAPSRSTNSSSGSSRRN